MILREVYFLDRVFSEFEVSTRKYGPEEIPYLDNFYAVWLHDKDALFSKEFQDYRSTNLFKVNNNNTRLICECVSR